MIDKNEKNKINNISRIVFCIMPVVESLNGMVGHHISDVYRLITVIYVLSFLFIYKKIVFKQTFFMILIITLYVSLIVMQFIIIYSYRLPFFSDLKSLSRILLSFIYFSYFYKAIKLNLLTKTDIKKYLIVLATLYAVCMFIPYMLGTGLATYDVQGSGFLSADQGIGFKGFFVEINSLSAILMGFLTFLGEELVKNIYDAKIKVTIFYLLEFLAILVSLLFTSTKTGLLFGAGYFILILIRIFLSRQTLKSVKIYIFVVLFGATAIFSPQIVAELQTSISGVFSRGQYFYQQMDGNLFQFITSSRSKFVLDNFQQLFASKDFSFVHLFGAGYYSNMQFVLTQRVITEMDIVDLYLSYGLVGCLLYLIYFKESILEILSSKKSSVRGMFYVMIIYSIFAGHVFVNAMTSTILALLYAYFIPYEKKRFEDENYA